MKNLFLTLALASATFSIATLNAANIDDINADWPDSDAATPTRGPRRSTRTTNNPLATRNREPGNDQTPSSSDDDNAETQLSAGFSTLTIPSASQDQAPVSLSSEQFELSASAQQALTEENGDFDELGKTKESEAKQCARIVAAIGAIGSDLQQLAVEIHAKPALAEHQQLQPGTPKQRSRSQSSSPHPLLKPASSSRTTSPISERKSRSNQASPASAGGENKQLEDLDETLAQQTSGDQDNGSQHQTGSPIEDPSNTVKTTLEKTSAGSNQELQASVHTSIKNMIPVQLQQQLQEHKNAALAITLMAMLMIIFPDRFANIAALPGDILLRFFNVCSSFLSTDGEHNHETWAEYFTAWSDYIFGMSEQEL